jgi:hypothetical protein
MVLSGLIFPHSGDWLEHRAQGLCGIPGRSKDAVIEHGSKSEPSKQMRHHFRGLKASEFIKKPQE